MHPSQARPERWANGGGWTRTLLAWPDPQPWVVRISVADVEQSGPFSVFAGVDRWFAVLEGDGVRLATAGQASVALRAGDADMHTFPGDAATDCELLGSATRDLNVMVRRDHARARVRRLRDGELRSNAELVGCFVCGDMKLVLACGPAAEKSALEKSALSRFSLAWLENPARDTLALRLASPAPRGWWIEVEGTGR